MRTARFDTEHRSRSFIVVSAPRRPRQRRDPSPSSCHVTLPANVILRECSNSVVPDKQPVIRYYRASYETAGALRKAAAP